MLLTKLHIPSTGVNLVHRSHLFEKLNKGLKRKLTLISAPAGFGKTTVISDWISQSKIPAAWCSIDTRDNDPIEFLKIVITAVQKKHNDIGKSSLELLKSPGTASVEYIIELFINDLLTLKNEIVLVLDDLHLISNKQVIDILSSLIDYKPKHLKLIISTRSDPPLPFARLRSQNEIIEIRSSDLSFSKIDISVLFNKKLKFGLTEKDLTILEQKTEGWIAGLQLTALTVRGQKDISGYIEKMAGDNRYIMDYLMEEVLNIQNEEMHQFLLFTSMLEKLSGPLCDTVLKKDNSQILLESLEKSNIFLISLDNERKWYRYHHLFSDILKHKLAVKYKEKIPELHHKASLWFEENSLPDFAIMHSLIGADAKRAIKLLDPIIGTINENLEYYRILKYGSLFKEDEIIGSKNICVTYAWTLALTGNLKNAKYYLEKLQEQLLPDNTENREILGKANVIYSYIFISEGNTKLAHEYSNCALKYLPQKNNSWNIWASILKGEIYLFRFELNKCLKSFEAAIDIGKKSNNSYLQLAIVSSAYVLMHKARYQESYNICNSLLETYVSDSNKDKYTASILYSIIGNIQIERNLLKEGFENVSKAYKYSEKSISASSKGYCTYIYAATCFKLGKIDKALSLINKLEHMLEESTFIGISTLTHSLKNKLFIEIGEFEKLDLPETCVFENDRSNILEYYFLNIVIARRHIYEFNYSNALQLLNELTAPLKNDEAFELLIETELLKSKALANIYC